VIRKTPAYRLTADESGVQLEVNDAFWNEKIIDTGTGTTQLDFNIAQVVQEIRAALYYIATKGTRH
jgi:hypothetical protein